MENSPKGGGWLWHSVLLANLSVSQLSTFFLAVQLPVCPGGYGLEVLTAVACFGGASSLPSVGTAV